MSGGTLTTSGTAPSLVVGEGLGASGYLNMSGGVMNLNEELDTGGNGGGGGTNTFGQIDMSGGTINIAAGNFYFLPNRGGNAESAVVNFLGGTVQPSATAGDSNFNGLSANWGTGSTSVTADYAAITFGGGQFLGPNNTVKLNDGVGYTTLGGSTLNFAALNLNSGTLQTLGFLNGGNVGAYVNFNGGYLKAGAAGNATFLTNVGAAYVNSGTSTIDNNGQSITIAQPLLAPTGNGITSVAVASGGSGYVTPPRVVITDSTGVDATGYATISGGAVTGIVITNPGVGFTSGTVTLVNPTGATAATLGTVTLAPSVGGSLNFKGTGTTSLTGNNTYTGATNVLGGNLALSGSGAINNTSGVIINGSGAKFVQDSSVAGTFPVTVTNGTLDGTGTLGAATLGNGTGAIIQNGDGSAGSLTLSSLTFTGASHGNLAIAGGTNFTSPALSVGTLTSPLNGLGSISLSIAATTPLVAGDTYDLIQFTSASSQASDFSILSAGTFSGRDLQLGETGSDLTLTVLANADSPKWTGLDNSNWQVGTTGSNDNWKLINAGTPTNYFSGDAVLFDDTASTGSVNISAANVTPLAVTFNNNSLPYTVTSTGGYGITGSGSVSLSGGGLVTFLTSNTYTGSTTISSGTLQLGNGSSGKDGTISGTSGITDNGALVYERFGNYTNGVAITGSGSVIVNGPGAETFSANNSYTGGTTVNGGTLTMGNVNAIGTNAALAVNGGVFDVGGLSPSIGTLNGSGGTIANNGTAAATLTIGAGNSSGSFGGAVADNTNAGTQTLSINKTGLGSIDLSGVISFTGPIGVNNGGTLVLNSLDNGGSIQLGGGGASGALVYTGPSVNSNRLVSAQAGIPGGNNIYLDQEGMGFLHFSNTSFFVSAGITHLVTLQGSSAGSAELDAAISDGSSATSVTKSGSGLWILGGTTTYTGTTTVNGGTLDVTGAISSSGTINVNSGTLILEASNATTTNVAVTDNGAWIFNGASPAIGILSGSGNILLNKAAGTGLTVSTPGSGDTIFSGTISDLGSGNGSLTTTGSGVAVLSGVNTYSGSTNVNSGFLDVSGSIANSNAINVIASANVATLQLDGANAVSSAATITTSTTGTALPVINVNAGQAFGAISNVGTINVGGGNSTAGKIDDPSIGQTSYLLVNGGNLSATHIRQGVLDIGSGSTVTIPSNPSGAFNPTSSLPSPTISVVNDLYNNGGSSSLTSGTLDLKNNALIVNDPNEASSIIAAVYNAADFNPGTGQNQWDAAGITSSSAQANASSYALGSLTGTELTNLGSTTFQGLPVTSNSTVVSYTLIGDTELRGTVDGTDYNNVLANYDTAGDWSQGNFYNESIVSGDDYNAVLNVYDVAASGAAKGLKPAITRSLSPALSPVATSGTFRLEVNTTSGDVVIFNDSTSSAPLTLYNIVDGSQQDLLIGNPADGNGTSGSIESGSPPYTNEHFLSVAQNDSNAVASITGRSSTNYKAWSLVLDGYNSNATALALSEGGVANKTDTINVPSFYSIDLGDIFNVGTTTVALTFQWGTETSAGGEGGTVYSNQPIDYIGTPEPASLGLLGLGGLAMMRRRRKA
jgi:autotransporter-associated beta strand protein